MSDKKILDITNIKAEFSKLQRNRQLLEKGFYAVLMDYKHYIDNSWDEKNIAQIREGVSYRFFSASFHLELFLLHKNHIFSLINNKLENNLFFLVKDGIDRKIFFDNSEKEISSLFESIIYHLVSIFDYLSILINYVCNDNINEKNQKPGWDTIRKRFKDKNNNHSNKIIAGSIKRIDENFVNKFKDYRNELIHKKSELAKLNMSWLGDGSNLKVNFVATSQITKYFHEIKERAKTHDISTSYLAFWLINKTTESVAELILMLRLEMEVNKKVNHGKIVLFNELTKEISPISRNFWSEFEKLNKDITNVYYQKKKEIMDSENR